MGVDDDDFEVYYDRKQGLYTPYDDKREKKQVFQEDDLVLRWDARREDHGKHGKFDNLWFGPFNVAQVLENNTFILEHLDDDQLTGGPVNGHYLKNLFVF